LRTTNAQHEGVESIIAEEYGNEMRNFMVGGAFPREGTKEASTVAEWKNDAEHVEGSRRFRISQKHVQIQITMTGIKMRLGCSTKFDEEEQENEKHQVNVETNPGQVSVLGVDGGTDNLAVKLGKLGSTIVEGQDLSGADKGEVTAEDRKGCVRKANQPRKGKFVLTTYRG
jgi:hypothetical protein